MSSSIRFKNLTEYLYQLSYEAKGLLGLHSTWVGNIRMCVALDHPNNMPHTSLGAAIFICDPFRPFLPYGGHQKSQKP